MRDHAVEGTVDERLARVEEQVQALLRVVADQAATIEAYERSSAAPSTGPLGVGGAPVPAPDDPSGTPPGGLPDPEPTVGRRRLLLGGATATAAATAALVAGTGTPAAAANGGNFILGQTNSATAETKLSYGGTGNNGLRVEGGSSLAMIEGYQTGTAAGVKGQHAGSGDGVVGLSGAGAGVYGESSTVGVSGKSTGSFIGVLGQSASVGVSGLSSGTDAGVYGQSEGPGVSGLSVGTGPGVTGKSAGHGVVGESTGGLSGVRGTSSAVGVEGIGAGVGVGVVALALGSNEALVATSTEGVGALLEGAKANLRLRPGTGRAAPTADLLPHSVGEVVVDASGAVWLNIASGTPGTWRKIGGPQTAGQLHVLPAPARVVDTRPGGVPASVLPKTPLAAGSTRVYDLKVNGSGVPAGATAALITVLLVNASNGNGNMTLWANGVAKPTANTMVWGAGSGRWTATAVSALDSQARVQVNVSARTDLVLDVVGYYR